MLSAVFKAYDVRGVYPNPLGEDDAWRIGFAAGTFLKQQIAGRKVARADTVLVSRDMRPSSPSMATALIEGIRAAGMNVIDLGMCDTSIIYFAVNHLGAAGGIQTTASHNPIQYNGFKISGDQAKPIGADTGLKEIQRLAEAAGPRGSVKSTGKLESHDLWNDYRKHVLKFLAPLKRKVRVFIDASNGMAGKLVPKVFDGVPNLEIVPLNFEITGSFVHEPNPLVAENMVPTQEGVRKERCDLGACFDGDADRCMLTDEKGGIIGCDHLTALLAHHFVAQERANSKRGDIPIVYDLRSSKVVEETVRSLGGTPVRSRVGHVFMKAMLREHDAVFGGELSGHFYFRDNNYADSGAITLAVAISVLAAGKSPLSELVAPFRKYPQSGELNFHVEDKAAVLAGLKKDYADAAIDELDGITVDAWDDSKIKNQKSKLKSDLGWWFNVRASNTEPLLRLNAEARDARILQSLLKQIQPRLGEPAKGH